MRKAMPCLLACSLLVTACTVGIVRREVLVPGTPAPPQPSPSPRLTDTAAPTATSTQTPLPSPTPCPTPTHTPYIPTRIPTIAPTQTPTSCVTAIGPAFASRLRAHPEVSLALGCPTAGEQMTWAAEQAFQHGRMFWLEETDAVYILHISDRTFQTGPDPYVEGDPEDACPEVGGAPAGLFKPVRGFNRQWCNVPGVRDGLGWALEREVGYDAPWQQFERGQVLQSRANHVFVLYEDGTWGYIE